MAQSKLTKTSMAKQFCCSGVVKVLTRSKKAKTAKMAARMKKPCENSHEGISRLPKGVLRSLVVAAASGESPARPRSFSMASPTSGPMWAAWALRSMPIMSRQTVLRSQTTCSRRCRRSSFLASSTSPLVTRLAYMPMILELFSSRCLRVASWKQWAGATLSWM